MGGTCPVTQQLRGCPFPTSEMQREVRSPLPSNIAGKRDTAQSLLSGARPVRTRPTTSSHQTHSDGYGCAKAYGEDKSVQNGASIQPGIHHTHGVAGDNHRQQSQPPADKVRDPACTGVPGDRCKMARCCHRGLWTIIPVSRGHMH